jgi:transposase
MRFEEAYTGWQEGRLSQEEAARLLGVCERTLRRQIDRYEADGMDGLIDKRLSQLSHKRAPVDEVMGLVDLYRSDYSGWNAKHFHAWYTRNHGGHRSYTWVKLRLQQAGEITRSKARGKHRKKRDREPLPGMMVHQDASSHEWIAGHRWDLVVTMDDATGDHLSMFFCDEEGTASSLHGIGQTIACHGLFSVFYTDRGSHYFHTPVAGGKVDQVNLTQVGRALKQLGIKHIAAYSPEARGRSERAFRTHQGRLPLELAKAGVTNMTEANRYLERTYMAQHNAEFKVPASAEGTAFIPYIGSNLPDVLCEQHERIVGNDNCVSFGGMKLQIPADGARCHYVKVTVRVHCYVDGSLGVFHGPRKLAGYDMHGNLPIRELKQAA